MALHLKRITWPYECFKCDVTKKILSYGDYYYEDDVDGLIVDAEYYHDKKMADKLEKAQDDFRYALNPEEYRLKMRQAERDFMEMTLLDREVYRPDKDGEK